MRRLLLAAASLAALAGTLVLAGPANGDGAPYSDPAAIGTITLCDVNGEVATHGDIHVKPFVWRAVGSTAAPGAYNGPGRTAALYGYQPIKDVDPGQWNGDYLTFSAAYTSASKPMAAATAADRSLADLLADYPPKWDGLVELRMFLGVPGQSTMTTSYNAATLKISGNNWTLVAGGHSGCDSGQATSGEMVLPSVAALPKPAANATTDAPAGATSGTKAGSKHPGEASGSAASSGAAASAPAGAPGAPGAQNAAATTSSSDDGSSATTWVLVVVAVLLAGGGLVWWRLQASRGAR
jgi:hypothetical protein